MKFPSIGCCAAAVAILSGCDRLGEVVDLGHKARQETKRERDRQAQVEERQASLEAERDSLAVLVAGKLLVLSNRVAETEVAIRTLRADRAAFSKELGAAMGGDRADGGVGLERALASPSVNALAMKYLRMDFSVVRGEYAEAIATARADEEEYRKAIRKLDQSFEEQVDRNPQQDPADRRARVIADLRREHRALEKKRVRLSREKIPTGHVYINQRVEHDREVSNVDTRLREVERMIDQLKKGDERERAEVDRIARRMREQALHERERAVEKLKREYGEKASVIKTVQSYNEKTLRRLERTFVKAAETLDEKLRKSREGYLTLQGIGASVPKLSADGVKKLQAQVSAL